MNRRPCAAGHDQAAVTGAREGRDGALDLGRIAHINWAWLRSERWRHRLDRPERPASRDEAGISKDRHARHVRRDLLEQLQPLYAHTVFGWSKTGNIAARPRQVADEARSDRIGDDHEYYRHRAGRLQQRSNSRCAGGENDVRRRCGHFRSLPAIDLTITA